MDLISVILFLVMYYIRPQDWLGVLASIHFVVIVMMMAVAALLFRQRSVKFGDLLRTPHDWMMLFFFAWMILTSPSPWETFKENYSLAIFYLVIVQTLTTQRRLKIFVGWWTFLIVAIAALAIASEYGFDPLNGYDVTHGRMKNRLILNLWIFNNPNALGHNVVPCIPMLYFFCIWKRPLFLKEVGLAVLIIPLWCIFLTVSKGAFLTGAVITVATLIFGRPKGVQAIIIAASLVFGGTLIYQLPRMGELDRAKTDPAIQGRVAAFKHGLNVLENSVRGVGRGNWMPSFFRAHHYNKACHSSYVQVGAELGTPGFFLFFGILYCCLRTLITAKTDNQDDERIRRTLFVLVLSYMVSSWMADFGFRPTFFMFSAAVAAFHRHLYGLSEPEPEAAEEMPSQLPAWRARLLPQPALSHALAAGGGPAAAVFTLNRFAPPAGSSLVAPASGSETSAGDPEASAPRDFWNKIGLLDLLLIAVMTWAAIRCWALMIEHM